MRQSYRAGWVHAEVNSTCGFELSEIGAEGKFGIAVNAFVMTWICYERFHTLYVFLAYRHREVS